MDNHTPTKRCSKCKSELPATSVYFKLDKRILSGISAICRSCANGQTSSYYATHTGRQRKENRERHEINRAPIQKTITEGDDTLIIFVIKLTKNYTSVVDAEDADLALLKWSARQDKNNRVYAQRSRPKVNGKSQPVVPLHRAILERIIGRPLEKHEHCDHADGNGLNNRRSNLRLATHSQNQANARKQIRNTSGYKGVHFCKARNKWQARICVRGKRIYIGNYRTKEKAYQAYCQAAVAFYGEFARFE